VSSTNPSPTALCTTSWRRLWEDHKANKLDVAPVSISLGLPKYWPQARAFPYLPDLAPDPSMLGMDEAGFMGAYFQKLNRIGIDSINAQLSQIREASGGQTLALCCFERFSVDCHRSLFSSFWARMTGELIEELPRDQLSMEER